MIEGSSLSNRDLILTAMVEISSNCHSGTRRNIPPRSAGGRALRVGGITQAMPPSYQPSEPARFARANKTQRSAVALRSTSMDQLLVSPALTFFRLATPRARV